MKTLPCDYNDDDDDVVVDILLSCCLIVLLFYCLVVLLSCKLLEVQKGRVAPKSCLRVSERRKEL